jgi:hypothetical protein
MAYTAPITFVNGVPLTAAQMNAIQDNIRETAVAKATTAGRHFVATGPNAIAERVTARQTVDVIGDVTSTTFTGTLSGPSTGPTVTATTSDKCLIMLHSYVRPLATGVTGLYGFSISGATTRAANDQEAFGVAGDGTIAVMGSTAQAIFFMTPGSNTFTAAYRTSSSSSRFDGRRMCVFAL